MWQRIVILTLCLYSANSLGNLPRESLVPGGVAVLELEDNGTTPVVTFNNKKCTIIKKQGKYFSLIGIPITTKPGKISVKVINKQQYIKTIDIVEKKYPEERLTIPDHKKVSPPASEINRIVQEQSDIRKVYKMFSSKELSDFSFIQPVEGRYSSLFGFKRILNGQAKNPHSGLDIANVTGTPIKAAAGGKVILTKDFYFNGNGVFIDHGQGLVTHYCHMDTIKVKEGQEVSQGEVIGTVGATGRVTGPHLHWSVILNGAAVDPLLFIS